ncbi:hypothetical protein QUF76_16975 [Desulfobacterales bacterium HSG16]|nr:hypothetical protein [Desulfobacterales bacterium HSG16]
MEKTFLFIGAIFFTLISQVSADSLWPNHSVNIVSESIPSGNSDSGKTRIWKIVPQKETDGSDSLIFFLGSSKTIICKLNKTKKEDETQIEWINPNNGQTEMSSDGLLILPGFPAPCNVLPVIPDESTESYKIKTRAGGRTFLKRYSVKRQHVDVETAANNGWIRIDIKNIDGQLVMISVFDEKDKPIVQQLWHTTGLWWLYEKTPFRHSWQVP